MKFPQSELPKNVQKWALAQAKKHQFETDAGPLTGEQIVDKLIQGVDEHSDFDPDTARELLIQTYRKRMGGAIASRQKRVNDTIRRKEEGFSGERDAYLRQLSEGTPLPNPLHELKHTMEWPVDMTNPSAHITCYFNDKNYSASPNVFSGVHNAVDVQLPLGTAITAPEDTIVLFWEDDIRNDDRELVDLVLYSHKSNLVYHLAHMDKLSLPLEIFHKARSFNPDSEIRVQQGEYLGRVGKFGPDYLKLHESIDVPNDVQEVYGRSYNHLHIDVSFQDLPSSPNDACSNPVNPLMLFKKLYT